MQHKHHLCCCCLLLFQIVGRLGGELLGVKPQNTTATLVAQNACPEIGCPCLPRMLAQRLVAHACPECLLRDWSRAPISEQAFWASMGNQSLGKHSGQPISEQGFWERILGNQSLSKSKLRDWLPRMLAQGLCKANQTIQLGCGPPKHKVRDKRRDKWQVRWFWGGS